MFLILASSCLARLHHSLLITRFLLPSTTPSSRARLQRATDPSATTSGPLPFTKGRALNPGFGVLCILGRITGAELAAGQERG